MIRRYPPTTCSKSSRLELRPIHVKYTSRHASHVSLRLRALHGWMQEASRQPTGALFSAAARPAGFRTNSSAFESCWLRQCSRPRLTGLQFSRTNAFIPPLWGVSMRGFSRSQLWSCETWGPSQSLFPFLFAFVHLSTRLHDMWSLAGSTP
ncbi:uncharacterized protein EI97DRAFT_171541 [Westerdykella ornata]|uniref:Uncharacterized protein n=1 Tax=Westerdykella ornata TaxID=318751 RepID=A0A6A6JRT5_WESOR|nr:uncharacterized protein EI97DRAFT_171541 [Westerdykella ornata]KAF2279282.1 hypothetical protein EI97DRAFT_171541 [Westerdykella ornata]